MALNVRIDFKNKYEIKPVSEDLRITTFVSIVQGDIPVLLQVEISNEAHELLPNVYNLAFGPLKTDGLIDDKVELAHQDYSKVFSTILLSAFTYLIRNPEHALGVDGSDNARAFLYYWTLQRNFDYLDQQFDIFGLKYYVRITRFGKKQYDDPFDFTDIVPEPVKIEKGAKMPPDLMYNYFIFKIKK